jgi:predicted subunit of tRNA(5-methylaminomethyl-2-thiouridylate) methyltransferase
MAAQIRSSIPAKPTVDNASRDDLAIGDVITLEAVPPAIGTTWAWTLVFVPEGSTAVLTPPAAAATPGPVDFTADLAGPYLVRLVVDAGLPTESTQYVRLRALTTSLGLKLVAAGERRDSTGVIPVDVDIEGWANEQNYNLQALESAIGSAGGDWVTATVAAPTYAASDGEFIIISVGTTEITLPAPSANARIAFKLAVTPVDVQVKTNAAGVTIDGTDYSAVGLPMTFQWEQFNVISDGTNWFIW